MHLACYGGHADAAQALIEAKADMSIRDSNGANPLQATCYKGYSHVLERLLECKAPVNVHVRAPPLLTPSYRMLAVFTQTFMIQKVAKRLRVKSASACAHPPKPAYTRTSDAFLQTHIPARACSHARVLARHNMLSLSSVCQTECKTSFALVCRQSEAGPRCTMHPRMDTLR